jgi:hypothetical protein
MLAGIAFRREQGDRSSGLERDLGAAEWLYDCAAGYVVALVAQLVGLGAKLVDDRFGRVAASAKVYADGDRERGERR